MPIIRCTDPRALDDALQHLRAQRGTALFVFFGSEDPGTGESWCKDCVTADPLIRMLCYELRPDDTLYECPVGERKAWKGQSDHVYKVHEQWRLQSIPTLILIEDGIERGRIGEQDCQDEKILRAFLSVPV